MRSRKEARSGNLGDPVAAGLANAPTFEVCNPLVALAEDADRIESPEYDPTVLDADREFVSFMDIEQPAGLRRNDDPSKVIDFSDHECAQD